MNKEQSRLPNLHIETMGNAAAPPVALLHGMMSTNRHWALNVDALATRFHLVLIELWGHGGSPAPASPSAYGAAGLVAALDDVRTGLGLPAWSLVGHSYGGAVALQYGLRRPAATTGIVWTNSRAAMSTATDAEAAEMVEALAGVDDPRQIAQHPINARRFPPDLHEAMIVDADATDLGALRALFRAHWSVASRDRLGELTMPVTLINGRFERLFQPEVDRIRATCPNVVVVDVDAGHSPNIEVPDEFNRLVVDALAGTLPSC